MRDPESRDDEPRPNPGAKQEIRHLHFESAER